MFCINWNRQCAFFNFRFWKATRERLGTKASKRKKNRREQKEQKKNVESNQCSGNFWWKSLKMICLHNKHLFALVSRHFFSVRCAAVALEQSWKAKTLFSPFKNSSEISWRKFIVQFLIHILTDYFPSATFLNRSGKFSFEHSFPLFSNLPSWHQMGYELFWYFQLFSFISSFVYKATCIRDLFMMTHIYDGRDLGEKVPSTWSQITRIYIRTGRMGDKQFVKLEHVWEIWLLFFVKWINNFLDRQGVLLFLLSDGTWQKVDIYKLFKALIFLKLLAQRSFDLEILDHRLKLFNLCRIYRI